MVYRNLEQKFTTFLQVQEDHNYLQIVNIQTDYKLLQNFHCLIEKIEGTKKLTFNYDQDVNNPLTHGELNKQPEFLAKVFLKNILNNQYKYREKQHLSAYLEETCFYLTNKELRSNICWGNLSILDIFSTARSFAAMPEKTLRNYDFITSKIDTFAKKCIRDATKECLLLHSNIHKYSDWGMLRHLSKKKFNEALRAYYGDANLIEHILIAIDSYKTLYQQKSTGKSLSEPNSIELVEMEKMYAQLCQTRNLKSLTNMTVNISPLLRLLHIGVESVRKYFQERFVPLPNSEDLNRQNQQMGKKEIDSLEMITLNNETELFVDQLTLSHLCQDVQLLLAQEFLHLPKNVQNMYILYYGLNFSQTDLGLISNLRQYQISRLLHRHQQPLLISLAKWSQTTNKICLNSEQINDLKIPMQDWLNIYCQKYFMQVLEICLLENFSAHLDILKYHFGQLLEPGNIAKKLDITELQVKESLMKTQVTLQKELENYIRQDLQINLDKLTEKSLTKYLTVFVKNSLFNLPYAEY